MVPIVNYNGDLVSKSTQAFAFNHLAVFNNEIIQENVRLLDGKLLYAEKHYFHLMAMMRMARMEIPMAFTPEHFYFEIQRLIDELNLINSKLTFNVSPNNSNIDFWITAKVLTNQLLIDDDYEIDQYRETHVSNGFHDRINFINPSSRILNTFAYENHLQDLILLNESKAIARAIHGNIFIIKDNNLHVIPIISGARDNTSRDMIIEAAKRAPELENIVEEPVFPFALMKADEVFISKDGEGVNAVSKFRKKTYVSEILPSIIAYFQERG